jgi:uncharacterized FlgJ-related protein
MKVDEENNLTLIGAVQNYFKTIQLELCQQSSTHESKKAFFHKLEPGIEGRIVIINQDTLPHLLSQRQFKEKNDIGTCQ